MAGGGAQVCSFFIFPSLIPLMCHFWSFSNQENIKQHLFVCFERSTSVASLKITWQGSIASLMSRCLINIIIITVVIFVILNIMMYYLATVNDVQILPILLSMDPDSLLNCGRSLSHQNIIAMLSKLNFWMIVNAGLLTVCTS